jgi:hypothetical protein
MTSKLSIASFDDDDFGFTIIDEKELTSIAEEEKETHQTEIEMLTTKLQQMYDAVLPLLKNLNANPDMDIIKWPNRSQKISQFKTKLDNIGGTYIKKKTL